MLPPDCHIHTPLCRHAEGAPAEYVEAARRRGLPAVCFADHCPVPDGYDPNYRMGMEDFPAYCASVRALQRSDGPAVLLGIEADYYPGCEAYLRGWLGRQEFDLVIGSIHYIAEWGFDNPAEIRGWESADVPTIWGRYFRLLTDMVRTGLYDIVGHADIPKKFGHRLAPDVLVELADPVLSAVADAGMAVELNTSGLRKPIGEIYPSLPVLSGARRRGIPICFGSDAHQPSEVGACFDAAVALARQAGYTSYVTYRRRRATSCPLPP